MNSELTIAIVTKNRPIQLTRCLKSICKQTLLPKQILVIDNDLTRSAYPIFKKYNAKIPIRYFLEKKSGTPYARNKALAVVKTKYLGFIDDDCILDTKWAEWAVAKIKSNKNAAYVCGKTNLYNNKNIWAVAQHIHDWYWYIKKIKKNGEITVEHFDTKNVVLNKDIILTNKLKFDPECGIKGFDSADFDFGLQLNHHHLYGFYSNKMQLAHEETSNFKRYILRAYYRGMNAGYINQKWRLDNKFVHLPKSSILVWLLRKIKKIPTDLVRYTNNIESPICFKILVVIAIIMYEGVYLKGYYNFKI